MYLYDDYISAKLCFVYAVILNQNILVAESLHARNLPFRQQTLSLTNTLYTHGNLFRQKIISSCLSLDPATFSVPAPVHHSNITQYFPLTSVLVIIRPCPIPFPNIFAISEFLLRTDFVLVIYFRYQRTIFATGEFCMDGFYAAGVFAIGEIYSLLANFFSLPCVSYALLTKICFWSWLQRDVALYPNAVVSLMYGMMQRRRQINRGDAGADKQRQCRRQTNRGEASSSARAQRDLFCFGSGIYCDTWQ